MRIVALSDTHGKYRDITVPDGDVLIHAGDMLKYGSRKEIPDFRDWIEELPHSVKIVIAGNHDWAFYKTPSEARELFGTEVHYLEDTWMIVHGYKIYGSPWQPRFFDWAFNLERGEALARVWRRIPIDTDILVTHGPPAGILDKNAGDIRFGDEDLLERIRQLPGLRYHIFGHAHGSYGHKSIPFLAALPTQFYNVSVCNESYDPVNQPVVIEV
jgi:Icc-related predicted phosphoesterase